MHEMPETHAKKILTAINLLPAPYCLWNGFKEIQIPQQNKAKNNKALRPSDEFPSNLSNFHRSEFIAKTSRTTVIPSYLPVVHSLMHINIFPQFKTFSSSNSSFENKITMMWVKGIFNVIQWARMWAAFHMRHKKRK